MELTKRELQYLEACMNVADDDGSHAHDYGVDQGELQVKLQDMIVIAEGSELQDSEV